MKEKNYTLSQVSYRARYARPFSSTLHEFDIHKDIQHFINTINIKQKRTLSGKQHNALGKIRYQLRKVRNKIKTTNTNSTQYEDLKKEEKTLVIKKLNCPTIIHKKS